jgi:hypothetical protein
MRTFYHPNKGMVPGNIDLLVKKYLKKTRSNYDEQHIKD